MCEVFLRNFPITNAEKCWKKNNIKNATYIHNNGGLLGENTTNCLKKHLTYNMLHLEKNCHWPKNTSKVQINTTKKKAMYVARMPFCKNSMCESTLGLVSHNVFGNMSAVFVAVVWAKTRKGYSKRKKYIFLPVYFPFLLNPLIALAHKTASKTAVVFYQKMCVIPPLRVPFHSAVTAWPWCS